MNYAENSIPSISQGQGTVTILLNRDAVKRVVQNKYPDDEDMLKKLVQQGVKPCVCENSLKKFDINSNDILSYFEIVPNGMELLITCQTRGDAYLYAYE